MDVSLVSEVALPILVRVRVEPVDLDVILGAAQLLVLLIALKEDKPTNFHIGKPFIFQRRPSNSPFSSKSG